MKIFGRFMMNNLDKKIVELTEKVNKQKEEIKKADKPSWNTNCLLKYGTETINLHTTNDVNYLVETASMLINKEKWFNETAKLLDVKVEKFKYFGFTISEWIEDIKTRINKINIIEKKKKLELLQKKLDSLMSHELKTEMELKVIEEELN